MIRPPFWTHSVGRCFVLICSICSYFSRAHENCRIMSAILNVINQLKSRDVDVCVCFSLFCFVKCYIILQLWSFYMISFFIIIIIVILLRLWHPKKENTSSNCFCVLIIVCFGCFVKYINIDYIRQLHWMLFSRKIWADLLWVWVEAWAHRFIYFFIIIFVVKVYLRNRALHHRYNYR